MSARTLLLRRSIMLGRAGQRSTRLATPARVNVARRGNAQQSGGSGGSAAPVVLLGAAVAVGYYFYSQVRN